MTLNAMAELIQHRLAIRDGLTITHAGALALARAARALSRWAELECGTGSATVTRSVERDPDGTPWMRVEARGHVWRHRTQDREAAALRRVRDVCARAGLHYYHQTDPRGCSLYVSAEPIGSADYNRGVACDV